MSFCKKCGAQNQTVELDTYSAETGKRETTERCPIRDCRHGVHDFKFTWRRFFTIEGFFLGRKCSYCDEIETSPYSGF